MPLSLLWPWRKREGGVKVQIRKSNSIFIFKLTPQNGLRVLVLSFTSVRGGQCITNTPVHHTPFSWPDPQPCYPKVQCDREWSLLRNPNTKDMRSGVKETEHSPLLSETGPWNVPRTLLISSLNPTLLVVYETLIYEWTLVSLTKITRFLRLTGVRTLGCL